MHQFDSSRSKAEQLIKKQKILHQNKAFIMPRYWIQFSYIKITNDISPIFNCG